MAGHFILISIDYFQRIYLNLIPTRMRQDFIIKTPTHDFICCFSPQTDSQPPFHTPKKWRHGCPRVTKRQKPFCWRESLVSIQPFLAELQAYVISIEVMPMKSQPGNKQPDRVHFLAALSLNRTKDCLLLVHCRTESLGPLYGHRHQLSRYHTSLHTFALIGKRALHILSSRI